VHVAASGVGMAGYLKLAMKVIGNDCTLLCVACNVMLVATWFRYTLDESYKSHGHMQWCQDAGELQQAL